MQISALKWLVIHTVAESQAQKNRAATRLFQQPLKHIGAIMDTIDTPGNTRSIATQSDLPRNVSRHPVTHQTAAMHAALLVRCQYSRAAKSQFSRLCLDHLKASLLAVQDACA